MKQKQHSQFMKRTASIYRHQRERAAAAGQVLNYDLPFLRWAASQLLEHGCPICREPVGVMAISFDHRTPIGRGGGFEAGNVVGVCRRCNETKGELTAFEFADLRDLMASWPEEARVSVLRRLRAGGRIMRRK